jgi:Toprim-like/CHC2 zinc finger
MELNFSYVDVVGAVELHTSTRLRPASRTGKQWIGACPYDDCLVDDDGFVVWPDLTTRGRHYYCRGCRRSGNIVKLVQEIRGVKFLEACNILGIPNPYGARNLEPAQTRLKTAHKRAVSISSHAQEELAFLKAISPRMQLALQTYERPQRYLQERGIPLEIAVREGLGYIPALSEMTRLTPELERYKAWCDRIVFPLQGKDGPGYTGRALTLWQPGMDEYRHKQRLDEQKILRWKTTQAGLFHGSAFSNEHITLVEGPFDALALLASGIDDVMATCGTSLDAEAIPRSVLAATLAFDGDPSGQKAAQHWEKVLRRLGVEMRRCTPPDDGRGKDWSERYRLHGSEGLLPLLVRSGSPASAPQSIQQTDILAGMSIQEGHRAEQTEEATGPAEQGHAPLVNESLMSCCALCGMDVEAHPDLDFRYTPQGVLYCMEHYGYWEQLPSASCCTCGQAATNFSPSGYYYCDAHDLCLRGHPFTWRKRSDGLWVCACYGQYQHSVQLGAMLFSPTLQYIEE